MSAEADPAALSDSAQRHALTVICLTVLIDTIGFGIILPVLPDLLQDVGGYSMAEATRVGGYLLIVYGVLQFFCGPLLGNLSDRFGRRPVILISLVAFGVDYLLMAIAPTVLWLFIGRAVAGIAGAIYGPAGAYIADVSTPEKRAQAFGMMGAMFGIGFVVGPAIGGFVAEFGVRAPFIVAGVLALLNAVYGFFALPESLRKENRRPFSLARANPFGAFRTFLKYPGVISLALVMFVWQLAHQVYPSTWSFFAKLKFDWSSGMIGLSLAYTGVMMAVVQGLLIGRIVKAIGEWRAATLGIAVASAGFVINAFATQTWMIYAAITVGALQGLAYASLQAIQTKRIPADAQGELQGGLASLTSVASVLGPLMMTQVLADYADPARPEPFAGGAFLLAAALGLGCVVTLLILMPKRAAATGS